MKRRLQEDLQIFLVPKESLFHLHPNLTQEDTISPEKMEGGDTDALREMRTIRATFRSKSSRLRKCSYRFYCKDVFIREEALRELENLVSKFENVSQDWFDSAWEKSVVMREHCEPDFPT